MSSVSPESSASNVVVSARGTVLSPALLIEQLADYTLGERLLLMKEYYRACAGSGVSEVVQSKKIVKADRGSQVSVESANGTLGYMGAVGKCYLRAVAREHRVQVSEKFGVQPTLRELLALPRYLFLPDSVLKKIRVKCGFEGIHHMDKDGEYDFLQLVRILALGHTWYSRSLAQRVLASDKRPMMGKVARVDLDDRLGLQVEQQIAKDVSVANLFVSGCRAGAGTLHSVLSNPVEKFFPRHQLLQYGLRKTEAGEIQLVKDGGEVTWMTCATYFSHFGTDYPQGSLGAVLKASSPQPVWDAAWLWSSFDKFVDEVAYDEGFCYRRVTSAQLGSWPTVEQLLNSPVSNVDSLEVVTSMSLIPVAQGRWHLQVGTDGLSFLKFLASVARGKCEEGKLSYILRGVDVPFARSFATLLHDRIGGNLKFDVVSR